MSSLFEPAAIYEHTAAILGTESLIMGITLLTLRTSLRNSGARAKSGLAFLAMALFALSVINLSEYVSGVDAGKEQYSLSIVIFASSVELFLMYMAYVSMLCKGFATRSRILFELACIAVFTVPAMTVSPDVHPQLFKALFGVGLVFYAVKLSCNLMVYHRQMRKTRAEVENYLSDDSSLWLNWITNTFYMVLAIGVVSVIVPMTNLRVLVCYNSFLVVAFFYIYISVIRNISIFDKSMSLLEHREEDEVDGRIDEKNVDKPALQADLCSRPAGDFIATRQKLLDDWIADRGYAVPGVTASEVAKSLRTNRLRLSQYLKNELHTTYYEWIASLRIEDAKRQLIEYPDRTIYEIAMNVGIEDRDNFRRAFQRHTGLSPTIYRKNGDGKLPPPRL